MATNKALIEPEKPCPMCKNKLVGQNWTQLILRGEKTSVEAASKLKMSIDDVETHVYKHASTMDVVVLNKPHQISRDKESFLVQLDDINEKLKTALDGIMLSPEFDTRQLTGLTKEIRETLKLLAEVAGVIGADNSAAMQKNLNDMQQKYLTLTGLILEVACPVCQQKIVARLNGVEYVKKEEGNEVTQ